jgi:hypothetical protein
MGLIINASRREENGNGAMIAMVQRSNMGSLATTILFSIGDIMPLSNNVHQTIGPSAVATVKHCDQQSPPL